VFYASLFLLTHSTVTLNFMFTVLLITDLCEWDPDPRARVCDIRTRGPP